MKLWRDISTIFKFLEIRLICILAPCINFWFNVIIFFTQFMSFFYFSYFIFMFLNLIFLDHNIVCKFLLFFKDIYIFIILYFWLTYFKLHFLHESRITLTLYFGEKLILTTVEWLEINSVSFHQWLSTNPALILLQGWLDFFCCVATCHWG